MLKLLYVFLSSVMGIGSSDCYRCDDPDCLELICCKISQNHEENEKEKESYDNLSSYRNAISDPSFAAKTAHDRVQCCHNYLKDCSHIKNQDQEFRCYCHSSCCNHGLSTPSCHSSTRSPASSGNRSNQQRPISFYHNVYGRFRQLMLWQPVLITQVWRQIRTWPIDIKKRRTCIITKDTLNSKKFTITSKT